MAKRRKTSWKSMTGVTSAKRKIANATGIPTTKQGREKKVDTMLTTGAGGGCSVCVFLTVLAIVLLALLII